jgi:hypothetical protein
MVKVPKSQANFFLVMILFCTFFISAEVDRVYDFSPQPFLNEYVAPAPSTEEFKIFIDAPTRSSSMHFSFENGLGALWKSTAALRDRNVVLGKNLGSVFVDKTEISAKVFANLFTERSYVFRDILNIDLVTAVLSGTDNADLVKLLDSISFSKEEVGVMFHGQYLYKNICLFVDVPLYVQFSHPWVPLEQLKSFGSVAPTPSTSDDLFTKEQIDDLKKQVTRVERSAGFGDAKLGAFYYQPLAQDKVMTVLGVDLVLPLKSFFNVRPSVGFEIENPPFNPNIGIFSDPVSRLKWAKRLITMVKSIGTNPRIGQKAIGFGVTGGVEFKLFKATKVYGVAQLMYICPSDEYRLIHRFWNDPDDGSRVLAPEPGEYLIRSYPGEILHCSAGISQQWSEKVSFELSGDLFLQKGEEMGHPFTELAIQGNLIKEPAKMNSVRQAIVSFKLDKKLKMNQGRAVLSFDASGSITASGIGKLWGVGLCLSTTF